MPIYSFLCESCSCEFDKFLSIDNRKNPETEQCPACNKKTVKSVPALIEIFSDSTLTANKKTKGDWNKLMDRIKKGVPKRVHSNLDKASSRTGRRHKG